MVATDVDPPQLTWFARARAGRVPEWWCRKLRVSSPPQRQPRATVEAGYISCRHWQANQWGSRHGSAFHARQT